MDPLAAVTALLCQPATYAHPVGTVRVIDTHISRVFLAGAFAYKVKKPVALGFLDFSTLDRRRHCCLAELRLNRRLAPQLYLAVQALTDGPAGPRLVPLEAIDEARVMEYVVRMRRFPDVTLLDRVPLDDALTDALAGRIASFHGALPPAAADSPFGAPDAILAPMLANFEHIGRAPLAADTRRTLRRLERWTRATHARLRPVLAARRAGGWIRECHGDLHRGNIVLLDGLPVPFDGIEFSPALRWIDCVSELAFLVMDLTAAAEREQAWRLLNRYLEATGDYAGLSVLRLYLVYRALVRAKVLAIRIGQLAAEPAPGTQETDSAILIRDFRAYLHLARRLAPRQRPRLILTSGPSGSGKSHLAAALAQRLGLIHLRADLERKRLFDLAPTDRPDAAAAALLYGAAASDRTYDRLLTLARNTLAAGFGVLVDATCLTRARRAPFIALSAAAGCHCRILDLTAPPAMLRQRVAARVAGNQDPSDADQAVLARQLAEQEPLTAAERALALTITPDTPLAAVMDWLER